MMHQNEQLKTLKSEDAVISEENTEENSTTTKLSRAEKPTKKEVDPTKFMSEERRKLLIVSDSIYIEI